jgi:HK97 family phage prohead protease
LTRHLLTTADFGAAVRAGQEPDAMVIGFGQTETKTGYDAATSRFVFSDGGVDHDGDTINPEGWDLSVFARNSVALWAHDSSAPPVGKASNVLVRNGKLVGDITFTPPETYGFGAMIGRLVKGGYLSAVSVGFKPTKWAFSTNRDRPNGVDFTEQQLLEISLCPLPANPRALVEARSAGIDTRPLRTWAERILDEGGEAGLTSRAQLEALHHQASDVAARVTYAAGLKRLLAAKREPLTPAERRVEVADLRRQLKARGWID